MSRTLEELSREASLQLLERASLGRVTVTIGALPAILPVNFTMFDGAIVFRTSPGSKLTAAVHEAVVAFEVDAADSHATTGWSVMVVGRASEILDEATLERARALELRPWSPDAGDHFVRIPLEFVTGRRIRAPIGDAHLD